jgi:hypothetical protein
VPEVSHCHPYLRPAACDLLLLLLLLLAAAARLRPGLRLRLLLRVVPQAFHKPQATTQQPRD